MQYMLLIHDAEELFDNLSEREVAAVMQGYMAFTTELQGAGALVDSNRLRPVSTATTVRVRDGERLVTDGPFAETKEQFGGYYLIEAKDLDEALDWAAKIPSAKFGSIEVRPVWDMGA